MVIPPPETQADEIGAAPAVAVRRGARSRLRANVAILAVAAVVLVCIIGYAVAGVIFASARISSADRTLNEVISHQNSLNKSLNDVSSTFSVLGSSTPYSATATQAAVDQFIAAAASASATVGQDDAALARASQGLKDMEWLTALARSNLDREATRIAHARKALGDAHIVALDYQMDGRFWEAFINTLQDLGAMTSAANNSDWAAARSAVARMQADAAGALQLADAPGLPPDLRAVMADFQTFVTDYAKLVDASAAGDATAVSVASGAIQTDAGRLGAYSFDKITADIAAFYKPLIDSFNSEMKLATS